MSRVLLVFDDDQEIGDLFRMFLRRAYDGVHVAHSSAEAERILAAHPVTHLVCDLSLGPDEPLGASLVARWRRACPSITYTAVFTGAADRTAQEKFDGVDEVFLKPTGFDALIERLRA